MKKLLITSVIVATLAATFYSFKATGEKENCSVALVSLVNGKGDGEGFLIQYGDGTFEIKPCEVKMTSMEVILKAQAKAAMIMNEMHEKGYRYAGMCTSATTSMVFEKK